MQLRTEIEIEAPATRVWEVLTDFPSYPDWNPFIASIAGKLEPGSQLSVELTPPEGRRMTFRPTLLSVVPQQEFRWRGKLYFDWLFSGEHFFQLQELAPTRTRFVHGEDFSGILLKVMNRALTQTARGFVGMNQALRRKVLDNSAADSPMM